MLQERGFTMLEILVVMALIGIISAISVPVFIESNARNQLWTASERVGALIRQTRLRAISTNTSFRVHFACPAAGDIRAIVLTGDLAIDDAPDRCSDTVDGDTDVMEMPTGVSYDPDDADYLQVNGRGVFTAAGSAIPLTIGVNHGSSTRTLTVSATGQITFSNVH